MIYLDSTIGPFYSAGFNKHILRHENILLIYMMFLEGAYCFDRRSVKKINSLGNGYIIVFNAKILFLRLL